jgi:uncharacterized OsmC-like protein
MSLTAIFDGVGAAVAADVNNAKATFRVAQELKGVTEVHGTTGTGHRVVVDEPPSLGGGNVGATPLEYALAAIGSCQLITYRLWAAKLGVRFDALSVEVEGDIDVRGFFGLDPKVRPGFGAIRVRLRVRGPETKARYDELRRVVDAHCPVFDLFTAATPVSVELTTG